MFDPLIMHSEMLRYKPVSFWDRFSNLNTISFWINFILPMTALLLFIWYMKTEYHRKKKLYDEYVPPHLNKYSDHYYKKQPIDPFRIS